MPPVPPTPSLLPGSTQRRQRPRSAYASVGAVSSSRLKQQRPDLLRPVSAGRQSAPQAHDRGSCVALKRAGRSYVPADSGCVMKEVVQPPRRPCTARPAARASAPDSGCVFKEAVQPPRRPCTARPAARASAPASHPMAMIADAMCFAGEDGVDILSASRRPRSAQARPRSSLRAQSPPKTPEHTRPLRLGDAASRNSFTARATKELQPRSSMAALMQQHRQVYGGATVGESSCSRPRAPPPGGARWVVLPAWPLLDVLPEDVLVRVSHGCGATTMASFALVARRFRITMSRAAGQALSDVHRVWDATARNTPHALSPLRQLHLAERMLALAAPTMAAFRRERPVILSPPRRHGKKEAVEIVTVSCGAQHMLMLDRYGGAWALGEAVAGGVVLDADMDPFADVTRARQVLALNEVVLTKVACGKGHTVAMSADGHVYTWGCVLADTRCSDARWLPPDIRRRHSCQAVDIAAGEAHAAAIGLVGDTYVWGQNYHGQCGKNPDTHSHTDSLCSQARVGGKLEIAIPRRAACGQYHTVVLTAEGSVFTFGDGLSGQLGRPCALALQPPAWDPARVNLTAGVRGEGVSKMAATADSEEFVIQVSCGCAHTVCLTDAGKVFAFGSGDRGQLGLGGVRSHRSPVWLRALGRVHEVAAGSGWTLLRARDGKIHLAGRTDEEDATNDCRLLRQL